MHNGHEAVQPHCCVELMHEQDRPQSKEQIERLFQILQDLNQTFYQKSLRSLVQDCEEKGAEHLLTITKLDLCHCRLQALPEEISLLTNLRSLRLINNQLTALPSSLLPLAENLRSLELEGNQLKSVPEVVHQIAMQRITKKKYFELFLRDNPMKKVPQELGPVVRSLPHSDSYFSSCH